MSYCRFQNTLEALKNCEDYLFEEVGDIDTISEEERNARTKLISLCVDIAVEYGKYIGRRCTER